MMIIPAAKQDGILVPSTPIPPDAYGVLCDGSSYHIAESQPEADALAASVLPDPAPPPTADGGE